MGTRRDLLAAMKTAGAFAGKSTLSILMCVRIATEDGRLSMTGFDLEAGATRRIPAQVQEPGAIALDAKLLSSILASLPDSHVELHAEDGMATIQCERARFSMTGLKAENFPEIPEPFSLQKNDEGDTARVGAVAVTMPAPALRGLLSTVIYAASKDQTRAVMCGILLRCKGGALSAAATDGNRLAVAEATVEDAPDFEAIIPERAARELLDVLGDGAVGMCIGYNMCTFTCGDTTLHTRAIEGPFPNFERVIPTAFRIALTFQRDELVAALKRVYVVAKMRNSPKVELETTRVGRVQVTARCATSEASEDVEVLGDGEYQAAVNVAFVLEALSTIESEGVRLEVNGALNPIKILPVDGSASLHIVMPMQLD